MKNKAEHRNQGYSLVELIVVIAILAVVSAGAVYGIGMLSGWEMKQCVRQLDSAIGETKMNAMSKGEGRLEISRDSAGNYYMEMITVKRDKADPKTAEDLRLGKAKIAGKNLQIYYVGDDAPEEQLITETNVIAISFDPGSGAFKPMQESPSTVYCRKLIVRRGTAREKTITLVKDTGRHYIE